MFRIGKREKKRTPLQKRRAGEEKKILAEQEEEGKENGKDRVRNEGKRSG